jgi:hypothetical protein
MWPGVAAGLAGMALLAWQIDRWQQATTVAESVVHVAAPAMVVAPQQQNARPAPAPAVAPARVLPGNALPSNIVATDPTAIRHTQGVAEVGIEGPAIERHPPPEQVEMLRIQVLGFEKVIRKLQAELVEREAAQIEAQRQIQTLQEKVVELRKQLDDSRRKPPSP